MPYGRWLENAIDYSDDDPEDEDSPRSCPALSYDEDNPDDEKSEVEAYDAEINEIAPDDLGEEVELNEEDDDEEYSDDEGRRRGRQSNLMMYYSYFLIWQSFILRYYNIGHFFYKKSRLPAQGAPFCFIIHEHVLNSNGRCILDKEYLWQQNIFLLQVV